MFKFQLKIENNLLEFQVGDEPKHVILLELLPEQDVYDYLKKYIEQGYKNWEKNKV